MAVFREHPPQVCDGATRLTRYGPPPTVIAALVPATHGAAGSGLDNEARSVPRNHTHAVYMLVRTALQKSPERAAQWVAGTSPAMSAEVARRLSTYGPSRRAFDGRYRITSTVGSQESC